MDERFRSIAAIAVMGALVSGCALNAGDLGRSDTITSSINTNTAQPSAIAAAQPPAACVGLKQTIDALRGEGFVGTVEKAAAGQSNSVTVKREDLVKMAELAKSNAAYQKYCSATSASSSAIRLSDPSRPTGVTAKSN